MDRNTIIDGLKMTMELCVFDPSTGEEIEPHLLNDISRATYDACKGALEILERLDPAPDTISRAKAIEICDHAIDLLKGQFGAGALVAIKESIEELPPALPEPMKIDLSRFSEDNWERIKKEWANTPITAITVEPTPDQNGDIWITVPDIDEVTCIYVQENKSKFCRIFYEEQPERIKGHWIVKPGSDAPPTCDNCGYESRTTIKEVVDQNLKMIYCTAIDIKSNFCPNCGAEMEVTE